MAPDLLRCPGPSRTRLGVTRFRDEAPRLAGKVAPKCVVKATTRSGPRRRTLGARSVSADRRTRRAASSQSRRRLTGARVERLTSVRGTEPSPETDDASASAARWSSVRQDHRAIGPRSRRAESSIPVRRGARAHVERRVRMPQDSLPFPPTPSASLAGRTMQESIYESRVQPRRLPEDAPNILIVLIDDAGPGLPDTFGGEVRTDDADPGPRRGDRLQPVPHDGDVLADAGVAADRAQPPPDRQRPDRRAGQRLGRLRGRDPEEQRARRRGAQGLRLRHRGVREVAQHPGDGDDRRRPVRQLADRRSASSTSTASSPARRRSTSPTSCATRPASLPPRTPEEGYHLSEDLADDAIGWLHRTRRSSPTSRSSCTGPAAACTARTTSTKEWADKYAGQVRRRLGRLPRARLPPRQGEGLDPGRRAAHAARSADAGVGGHPRGARRPFQRRLMEVAAGLRRARRRPGRPADRRDRPPRATARTR